MRRPADVFLFYAARATRGLGDGFAIITLPAYLSELGFGPFQIGIVASLNGHRHARNRICRSQQGPAQSSVARRFRDSCDGPRISGHRAVCAHSRDRVCRHKESLHPHYRIDLHQSTNLPRERPHRKRRRVTKPAIDGPRGSQRTTVRRGPVTTCALFKCKDPHVQASESGGHLCQL
jgi:hypothetical protein